MKQVFLIVLLGCVFATFAQKPQKQPTKQKSIPEKAYGKAEVQPQYPGGMEVLYRFIGENINYPEQAKANKVQGTVVLSFVIEKDGSVENVMVAKSLGSGCDEEAKRVLLAAGKWIPGTVDGEPVRVYFVMPFKYQLDDNEGTQERKK